MWRAALLVGLLAGCASSLGRAPGPPAPAGLAATACEKRALMTGQSPDPSDPAVVAESVRWGVLGPESCPDGGGRLDADLR